MVDYENLLSNLSHGNLAEYQAAIRSMSGREVAHYCYWLHFVAPDTFNDILLTRAFLHNKLTFEVNNFGHRSKEKHPASDRISNGTRVSH